MPIEERANYWPRVSQWELVLCCTEGREVWGYTAVKMKIVIFWAVMELQRSLTDWKTRRLTKWMTDFLMMSEWVIGQLTNRLIGWLTNRLTEWLTQRDSVVLQKPLVPQLVKKFLTFYETWSFITVFQGSWSRSVQFIPFHYVSLKSVLILPSHVRLDLSPGLFPSSTHREAPPYTVFSNLLLRPPLLSPNIVLTTLFSKTPTLYCSFIVTDQVSHPHNTADKVTVLYVFIFIF